MRTVSRSPCWPVLVIAIVFSAILTRSLCPIALAIPANSLAVTLSGNNPVLSFPTTSPQLYTVQTSPDLVHLWTNLVTAIQGDGTVKMVALTNGIMGGNGFYRLLIQTPVRLILPQGDAFAILGHSCGGIKEQSYVTGFDQTTGYPIGNVYLSTTCSTGGRGSRPATFTAWAAVTWDLAGNVISSSTLSNAAAIDPTFTATDSYGDVIYNAHAWAYLVVPTPAMPAGVSAVQSGDNFQVSWTPQDVSPAAVTTSTVTATPVDSKAPVLRATVSGSATAAIITPLEPQTMYQITVVNTTIGGSSPASIPIRMTTSVASMPPSAPTGVAARWTNLDPTGATDTIIVTWQAAVPGDSPIDQYLITINGSDGAGTFTQIVSGTTLSASFNVDYIPNWSGNVQAHNAVGWGPASATFSLGGL